MKIADALKTAAERLRNSGISEFRREASSLLAFALQKEAAFLVAHPEYELAADESTKFEEYVGRRARREPFQYIVGRQEFYGLEFELTPDVLIPRPETEILVESAIGILSDLDDPQFLEIGVGSGCIFVAILHAVASASAVGVDISQRALDIAHRNSEKHKVDGRLELQRGDTFSGVSGTFDMIVSNPPYVPHDHLDALQAEVRDFEPSLALDGGEDGLSIIGTIIRESPAFLKSDGFLLLEIGFDQAAKVRELFVPGLWQAPEFLLDLQEIPRILKVRKIRAE